MDLGKSTVAAQKEIKSIRSELASSSGVDFSIESPVDFSEGASKIIASPALSNDAMKMDIQFFRNESSSQKEAESHANTISSYVNSMFSSWSGPQEASKLSKSTHSAVHQQGTNHDVESTLVICANCTHKGGTLFAPLVLDPEKSIKAWNESYPEDAIPTDPTSICQLAGKPISKRLQAKIDKLNGGGSGGDTKKGDDQKKKAPPSGSKKGGGGGGNVLRILTGSTNGSSFVGFIHTLRSQTTSATDKSKEEEIRKEVKSHVKKLLFLRSLAGQFGLSREDLEKTKNLLSTLNVSTHCSIVTEGIIPRLSSGHVDTFASQHLAPSLSESQQAVKAHNAQGATGDDSPDAVAGQNRVGVQVMEMQKAQYSNALEALGNWDKLQNQTLDMNTLFSAFSDYVQKAEKGEAGRPINYFFKTITKQDVALLYFNAHYSMKALDADPEGMEEEKEEEEQQQGKNKKKQSTKSDTKSLDKFFDRFFDMAAGGGGGDSNDDDDIQGVFNQFETKITGEKDETKRKAAFAKLKSEMLERLHQRQQSSSSHDQSIKQQLSDDNDPPSLAASSGSQDSAERSQASGDTNYLTPSNSNEEQGGSGGRK